MLTLRLASGESCRTGSFERDILGLISPRALAVGTPVRLVAVMRGGELNLTGKCIAANTTGDGRFRLAIRLINLRGADRTRLETEFNSEAGEKAPRR